MAKVQPLDPFVGNKRSTSAWIKAGIALSGLTNKEIAKKTGISETTIGYRIRNPATLREGERWELIRVIGTPQKVAAGILEGEP